MLTDTSGIIESVQSAVTDIQGITLDRALDVFANQRRRYAIYYLQQHDKPMALAAVADEIAVYEDETDITDIPAEEIKPVYASLYHSHIPKLADAGIVEYNEDRNTATLTEESTQ